MESQIPFPEVKKIPIPYPQRDPLKVMFQGGKKAPLPGKFLNFFILLLPGEPEPFFQGKEKARLLRKSPGHKPFYCTLRKGKSQENGFFRKS
jgi:hypothetical protein